MKIFVFAAFFNETKGRIRKKRRLFLFRRLRKHLSKDEMGQSGDHSVRHNRPATFLAISKQHRWHSCEKLQMDVRSLLSVQVSIILFFLFRFISSISTFIGSLAETLKFDLWNHRCYIDLLNCSRIKEICFFFSFRSREFWYFCFFFLRYGFFLTFFL